MHPRKEENTQTVTSVRYWHGAQPNGGYHKPHESEFTAFSNPINRKNKNPLIVADQIGLSDRINIQHHPIAGDLITGIHVETTSINTLFENSNNPKVRLLGMFHDMALESGSPAVASDIYRIAFLQEHKGKLTSYLDWDVASDMYNNYQISLADRKKEYQKLLKNAKKNYERTGSRVAAHKIQMLQKDIDKISLELSQSNSSGQTHFHDCILTQLGTSKEAIDKGKHLNEDLLEIFINKERATLLGNGVTSTYHENDILTGVKNNTEDIDRLTNITLAHLMDVFTSSPYLELDDTPQTYDYDNFYATTPNYSVARLIEQRETLLQHEHPQLLEFIHVHQDQPDFEIQFKKEFRKRRTALLKAMAKVPHDKAFGFTCIASYFSNARIQGNEGASDLIQAINITAGPTVFEQTNKGKATPYGQIGKLHGEGKKLKTKTSRSWF